MQWAWPKWFEFFPQYQCTLKEEGEIIACVNAVPLFWDAPFEQLPDGLESADSGWDWVVTQSIMDFNNGVTPNALSAAAIVVAKQAQGRGLAAEAVQHLKTMARENGLKAVIAPLRPSKKREYPHLEIEEYIQMRQEGSDLPFDPWLRLHVKLGGRIIKPCLESVVISENLDTWTKWTGVKFPQSGLYDIPGGDEPLIADVEENRGDYAASGVWTVHDV